MVTLRHLLMSSSLSSLLRSVKIFPHMTLFPISSVPRTRSLPRNVAITLILTQTWIVVALGTRPMGIRKKSILGLILVLYLQLNLSLGENQALHLPVVLKARRTGRQGGGRGVSVSTGCTVMQPKVYSREFLQIVYTICADLISIQKEQFKSGYLKVLVIWVG